MIRGSNETYIDRRYYDNLVEEAINTISQYGDFEMFVSDIKENNNDNWTNVLYPELILLEDYG